MTPRICLIFLWVFVSSEPYWTTSISSALTSNGSKVLSNFAPAIKTSESLLATKEAFTPDGIYTPSGSPSQTSLVLVPMLFASKPSAEILIVPVAGTIQVS